MRILLYMNDKLSVKEYQSRWMADPSDVIIRFNYA